MEMPAILKGESLTRLAQGACVGALGAIVVGFSWGGWVTDKTAKTNATMLVNAALVQAYGPVCIERFKHQPNVEAKWAELTKVETWRRDTYIKESGFATPPGAEAPNSAVADACADALSKVIAMQTPATK
jgi:pimeloyl-ACP methyl ester carboxylesterase